eukprot:11238603-Alexandrium_andersonii.AAC.1
MGEETFTQQLGAPRSSASSCSVRALSPIVWCPFGGGSEGVQVSLCGGGLPSPTERRGWCTDLNRVAPT